jgi:hypothetical protein
MGSSDLVLILASFISLALLFAQLRRFANEVNVRRIQEILEQGRKRR